MPPKRNINNDNENIYIAKFKTQEGYKKMKIIYDDLKNKLETIFNNNKFDLKNQFEEVQSNFRDMDNATQSAWLNGIMYIDFPNNDFPQPINNISLKLFAEGEYKDKYVPKPNTIATEKSYANTIKFFTKTFPSLSQYKDVDDISWMIPNNRLLTYEIINYNNTTNNKQGTLNKHFKALVRCYVLMLGAQDELKNKFSVLQIGLNQIDGKKDDMNIVSTEQELKQFVPYEQLVDIIEELESQYKTEIAKLPPTIQNDGKKHSNDIFNLHQKILALALYVFDYPSRKEKMVMSFLTDEKDAKEEENYILMSQPTVKVLYNAEKKGHKNTKYILSCTQTGLSQYNKRLNKLIQYSYKTYPRPHLFIALNGWRAQKLDKLDKSGDTVAGWIRELIPSKNLGVDGFRSAFASYWFYRSNNLQKNMMARRMRTSVQTILKSYVKHYQNTDTLAKVKIEPTDDLVQHANSNNIDLSNANNNNRPQRQQVNNNNLIAQQIRRVEPVISSHERKANNFKRWYENPENKKEHLAKVKEHSKLPLTYAKRIVRELNSGLQEYNRMTSTTLEKYGIKVKDGIYYSELL